MSLVGDVLIFFDPLFEEHKTGYGHPERPERLPVALKAINESGLLNTVEIKSPGDATVEQIELIHSPHYIEQVRNIADSGGGNLDMDTSLSGASYRAALKAAGALIESVDGCSTGEFKKSFCLVRPPGHHSLPDRGMGFCLFNNVAIGARYGQKEKGLERVMIVDWDAHHGNGTQDVFYDDPSVLYVSLHQYPHYPGSGWVDEIGSGKGNGYTINFPFPAGTGEDQYMEAFERVVLPAGRKFKPDLIMVSAGYDGHFTDLLCSMRLSDGSYRKMADSLVELSEECCDGKLIMTLEGGYNLDAQAHSIVQTIAGLARLDIPVKDEPPEATAYYDRAGEIITQAERLWRGSV